MPKPSKKIVSNDVSLDTLAPNARNPRKAWRDAEQVDAFRRALATFGDLSGIVFNRSTATLVGGHKRVAEFRGDSGAKVVLDTKLDTPDASGTLAYGHVHLSNGVRFAYREVGWDTNKEKAAMIAANRWSAEWDMPGLGGLLEELSSIEDLEFSIDVTGFDGALPNGVLPDTGTGTTTGVSDDYVHTVKAPLYQCTGECPALADLANRERADSLIRDIEAAKVPEDVKDFLRCAAERHVRFDYAKIAEYYAHAPKEVQKLMEDSALVIIDFKSAMEKGYAQLREGVRHLFASEAETTDEESDEDQD